MVCWPGRPAGSGTKVRDGMRAVIGWRGIGLVVGCLLYVASFHSEVFLEGYSVASVFAVQKQPLLF